ncbi:PREDICTED: uncharacterized protein LOC109218432 [Nicotiana attenuata]|uniref:uncharacterized protein LOC109218432 n=1 Tax=Nicotiana attenuata TaxID=49451 RepID=UPI0009050B09|nr:PREDICTED: uncharacterized protein LOC109218432 [Nicotiana attenuata]
MHRKYHFEFIGLIEPKQQSRKLDGYRRQIDFEQAIVNTSNKIWAFIDGKYDLYDTEEEKEFMVTLVYAKCDHIERIELWDSLYYLASDMTIPCMVGGDFNVILDEEEKFGGLPVSINEVDNFRHCMNTCNLTNMGFKGSIYTWWNGRAEEDCIFKRLDRFFANMELQQIWPGLEITHLSKIGSDHCPLLISFIPDTENWQTDFQANPFIIFNHKLKRLKKALSTWSRTTFGDIFQKIASLEEVVVVHEAHFELNPTIQNRERLQKVKVELFKYLALEEQFWKQKSGMTWFNYGDRNTKLFHAHVNGKRKRLQLKRIQNNAGQWVKDTEGIADEAVRFFQAQFHEDVVPTDSQIINRVPQMVNGEQNQELLKQPTREEVKQAVYG